ncbi:diguanylate cyclase [Acinetobacter proteolyticus]|uniref:diguanylate cyclase n=1 Tax=Acinetobacter proteolyticus TaxID=1776741 RepID=A0A1E7R9X0_9GAMM|nr:GGDEF domain-containing protein [Acinetobacter proteolyticus]OEY96092.1 diguanylate cyclase [Acinetobacter proteolyticus]PKF32001.1 GGDEF domain-containing protein [Acinetobacter proteolyticus]QHH94598.1 diguanylate cyclase [Acinetobacter gyllenbergii]
MDNSYDLDQLRRSKEDLEQLVAQHSKSKNTHQTLPQKLENEFWKFNVDRTRLNAIQFFGQGVITYTIFVLLILPSNFLVIRGSTYFVLDFIYSILSLIVVGIALFLFWAFSRFKKLNALFYPAACLIVFLTIVLTSVLMMSVSNLVLQNQAMVLIAFLYMLGFILSGIRPLHMLWIGSLAAITILFLLYGADNSSDFLMVGRTLIGSLLLGFSISVMLTSKERKIFIKSKISEIDEQILRIQASELLHLSQHDELTDVSNRRTFEEMCTYYYDLACKERKSLSVLFIDIDYFKNYNDFYGHQMGDQVISAIAKTIKSSIRHMDFIARYGGEEFVVLLPETSAQGAYAVATNIYRAIDRLMIPHDKSLVSNHVTISLGITVFNGNAKISQEMLIHTADKALYRAKQLGRNQIYYQPLPNIEENI